MRFNLNTLYEILIIHCLHLLGAIILFAAMHSPLVIAISLGLMSITCFCLSIAALIYIAKQSFTDRRQQ